MKKVRIKSLPNSAREQELRTTNSAPKVPWKYANMEVEDGETIFGFDNADPYLFFFNGKKHSEGGIPYIGKDGDFVFSDYKDLKIKGSMLPSFNLEPNRKYSFADISKKYDINKYQSVLKDKDADRYDINTARLNLSNAVNKLSELAYEQEKYKGFPNGIPDVANIYLEQHPEKLEEAEQIIQQNNNINYMQKGGQKRIVKIMSLPKFQTQGEYQYSIPVLEKHKENTYALDADRRYKILEYAVLSNSDLQNKLYQEYLKEIDNAPNDRLSKDEKDKLKNVPQNDVIKKFLDFQKQVYTYGALNEVTPTYDPAGYYDKAKTSRAKYEALAKKYNFEPYTPEDGAIFQAVYRGFINTLNDPKYKDYTKGFVARQFGKQDEGSKPGNIYDQISRVDKVIGNTTLGQGIWYTGELDKNENKVQEDKKDKNIEKDKDETYFGKINPNYKPGYNRRPRYGWTVQDINNFNNTLYNYLSRETDYPQRLSIEPAYEDYVYLDPMSQIFAQQSNFAKQADALSAFAGPQTTAATIGALAGQNAAQLAQIIGNYDNQNVNIANRLEDVNTGIYNQFAPTKLQLQQRFLDTLATANAQRRLEEETYRNLLVDAYNKGLTNAGKIYNVNLLNDKYQIDPYFQTAYFHHGSPSIFESSTEKTDEESIIDKYFKLANKYNTDMKTIHSILNDYDEENTNKKNKKNKNSEYLNMLYKALGYDTD